MIIDTLAARLRHGPWLALLCLTALGGCTQAPRGVAESSPARVPDAVPHSREADDAARFLAGMPGTTGSPYATLETTEAWQEHRRLLDSAWRKADAGFVRGLRKFQNAELNAGPMRTAVVFYPFSGPDSLTACLSFPDSPRYVLVGLEPAGTLPSVKQLSGKDLTQYLAGTRDTVASVLGRSFFITRQMDSQFRGQVTDGLLLPILELLVRMDYSILGYRYVRLNDRGQVVDRETNYKPEGRPANRGVDIEFRSNADRSLHRMLYFSVNLSDERVRTNKPFLEFAATLKGATSLLKATSYMTHNDDFSAIRDLVLTNSGAVLQDDSGIPYKYFQPDQWNLQLFGDYERPYGSFRWREQPDLRQAFHSPGTKPLGFKIGYGYARIPSNLLLAKRTPHVAQAR